MALCWLLVVRYLINLHCILADCARLYCYCRHGYWVYDFALPLLMLHAFNFKTAESLKHWLSICPRRQITTLDTHDGMGVDDITVRSVMVKVPYKCVVGKSAKQAANWWSAMQTVHRNNTSVARVKAPCMLMGSAANVRRDSLDRICH